MAQASAAGEAAVQATLLAQMGESYAVSRAWMDTLQKEDRRLKVLDTRATRQGHSVAGNTLDVAYSRHRTRWITRTLIVTLAANMCIMAPAALFRMGTVSASTAYSIAGLAGIVYAVILIIIVRNIAFRRRDDWDKYYFRADSVSRQAQDSSPVDGHC